MKGKKKSKCNRSENICEMRKFFEVPDKFYESDSTQEPLRLKKVFYGMTQIIPTD